MSLKYSASTEKSPQPGHHVGLSAASSFFVSGFRSSGSAMALLIMVVLFKLSVLGGLKFFLHTFKDVAYTPSEAVGLIDALNLGVAEFCA